MRFLTLSLFTALMSAPAFAADLGTYRPGTPYNSTVAGGADVCESQCAGDAQCRGWNYVKPNPKATGICEFLSSISTPISSSVSISGESHSAESFSSRVTQGTTNTVRVGTQTALPSNTVRVGQAAPSRTIVRQAQPERVVPQRTSSHSAENLSLTEQQNRFRQAQGFTAAQPKPQSLSPRAVTPQTRGFVPPQRPSFRPILDGATPQIIGQPFPQPQALSPQRHTSRRVTGPRNRVRGQAYGAPQFQDPRFQNPNFQNPNFQAPRGQGQPYPAQPYPAQAFQAPHIPSQPYPQQQAARRGPSKPPIGQPIPAPELPVAPVPTTPSQRLAALTAQTRTQANTAAPAVSGTAALPPTQARQSLFGRLNDDVSSPPIPTSSAVPTQPVIEQALDDVLAGGY